MAGIGKGARGVLFPTPLKVDLQSRSNSKTDFRGLPAFCGFLNTFFEIAKAHGTWQWISNLTRETKEKEAADLQKASKRLAEYSDEKLQELRDKYDAASVARGAAYKVKAKVLIVVPIHTSPDTYLYTALLAHIYKLTHALTHLRLSLSLVSTWLEMGGREATTLARMDGLSYARISIVRKIMADMQRFLL